MGEVRHDRRLTEVTSPGGTGSLWKLLTAGTPTGIGALLLALVAVGWNFMEASKREVQSATGVIAQHERDMERFKEDIADLRRRVLEAQAELDLGGRFTDRDGEKVSRRIDRLEYRIELLERRLFPSTTTKKPSEFIPRPTRPDVIESVGSGNH